MLKKYSTMFIALFLMATMLTACASTNSDGALKLFNGKPNSTVKNDNSSSEGLTSEELTNSTESGDTMTSTNNPSSSDNQSQNNPSSSDNQPSSNESTVTPPVATTKGVIVELQKKNNNRGTYSDFYVYVRTSDPSGKYYIRYNFVYEYSTEISNKSNSTENIDAFRIKSAYLTEVISVTDTSIIRDDICQVLQQGEILLAVKEENTNDYLGGYHGDDHMTEFKLTIGGKEYKPGESTQVIQCDTVKIHQVDILNRCGVANDNVLKHTQEFTIDTDGVKTNKKVEWLTDNFKLYQAYLQMFTMYRKSGGNTVCERVSTYDGYGNFLGTKAITGSVSSEYKILEDSDIREVQYSSATSGISAKVGFNIVENSVKVKSARINVRTHGDNKWYADFCPISGSNPKAGDVWEINTYFDIDYVARK